MRAAWIALALAAALVALHLLSIRFETGALWGTHFWAFLSGWACVATLLPTLAAGAWLVAGLRRGAPRSVVAMHLEPGRSSPARAFAGVVVAMIVAGACFWAIRARHVLLGDGVAILSHGSSGPLHELEPLTVLIQAKAFTLWSAIAGAGHSMRELTWASVALVSIFAGVVFVPVAWALAGEIVSAAPLGSASSASDRFPRALVFAALVLQGYVQLFCGYVENYAPLLAANALVLLTGVRFARGRGSALAMGAAMWLGIALHLSAFALFPAFALLVAWRLARGPDRALIVRDLALTLVIGVAITVALAWKQPGYVLPRTLWDVTVRALGQRQEDPGYLLSLRHARDFANEQLLIGPLGLWMFLLGLVAVAARRRFGDPATPFVIVAGLGYAGACALAGDSNLGYARNWDLLAPAGVVFTAGGLLLALPIVRDPSLRTRILTLAAALSLFHTLPWIAVNASEARGLRRFETLPLGDGRTENTVAFWYAERHDFPEAKRWLGRALRADPTNNRAVDLMGRIAFEEHDAHRALECYFVAVTLRPDKPEYRRQLATAVAGVGGPGPALAQLDAMMAEHGDNGTLWLERSMLLRAMGRTDEAAAAKQRALRLVPGLAPFEDRLPATETSR